MNQINHQVTAVATAIAFGFNIVETVCVAIGAVLPNAIERLIAGNSNAVWYKIHRKFFHWWGLYLIFIVIASNFSDNNYVRLSMYVAVGAYMHIIGDALTVHGVPLLNPFERGLSMSYFLSGQDEEYKYVMIYLIIMIVIITVFTDFNFHNFIFSSGQELGQRIENFFEYFKKKLLN